MHEWVGGDHLCSGGDQFAFVAGSSSAAGGVTASCAPKFLFVRVLCCYERRDFTCALAA